MIDNKNYETISLINSNPPTLKEMLYLKWKNWNWQWKKND